jgi:hypothetical protein
MTDYTQLITSEHKKPKFTAIVKLLTDAVNSNTQLVKSLPVLFDVDVAIGDQLDKIGEWVGVSRFISPSIENTFFSFNIVGLGFNQGVWKDKYSNTGLSVLDDQTYRKIIYAKIIFNNWDGTAQQIVNGLSAAFPGIAFVVQDNGDMTMNLGVIGVIIPLIKALLVRGYFSIRPAGVSMSIIVPSNSTGPFFGFGVQNSNISGFNAGYWSNILT